MGLDTYVMIQDWRGGAGSHKAVTFNWICESVMPVTEMLRPSGDGCCGGCCLCSRPTVDYEVTCVSVH